MGGAVVEGSQCCLRLRQTYQAECVAFRLGCSGKWPVHQMPQPLLHEV